MSPSPTDAVSPALAAATVPEGMLNEGEVIILSIRPSPWFIILESRQVLTAAFLLPVMVFIAMNTLNFRVGLGVTNLAWWCAAAGVLRLTLAGFQWMGRLYVLTNARVLRISGVIRTDVFNCPLKAIVDVQLSSMIVERPLDIGSVTFVTAKGESIENAWLHVPRLHHVYDLITKAIARLR